MNQRAQLLRIFKSAYDDDPWIDVPIKDVLEGISAKQAASRPVPDANTIWEIVNHMIAWQRSIIRRLGGEVFPAPKHNYIQPIADTSEAAWDTTRKAMADARKQILNFLESYDLSGLENNYPGSTLPNFEQLYGLLQHDSYHLGQIVILRKLV